MKVSHMFTSLIEKIQECDFTCFNTIEIVDDILYLHCAPSSDYKIFKEVVLVNELVDVGVFNVNYLDNSIKIESR